MAVFLVPGPDDGCVVDPGTPGRPCFGFRGRTTAVSWAPGPNDGAFLLFFVRRA